MKSSILAAFQKRANYVAQAKAAGWLDRPGLIGDGVNFEIYATVPRPQVLDYYMVKIIGRVDGWGSLNPSLQFVGPSTYGWSEEDDFYWERRILFPWLFLTVPTPTVAPEPEPETPPPAEAPPLSLAEEAATGIIKQAGLLQDDILYNLSLLCANVLQPVKNKYPNMTIVSGLRQFNTGMSQHERGEAADIQINGQTPALLYEVATYIATSLQFDQMILHYSSAPELSWIHVSFSAQELRRSVLTRDYDDTYYDGLYLIEPLTGEERAAAVREQEADIAAVDAELSILSARDAAFQTSVVDKDVAAVLTEPEPEDPAAEEADGSGGTGESQGGGGGYD